MTDPFRVEGVLILITKGGPDARLVPDWFFSMAQCIYYGGIIYLLICIHIFKKGLKDVWTLQKQYTNEYDERRRDLHEKSGGTAAAILVLAVILKVVSYVIAGNSSR